mmetsp:Transcript_44126/g.88494  ORF Transcript_44126/g.88494 Transcript_44126/m.88494 type:complete len:343 (-) Transcript_44126:194-1222(-)
MEIPWSFISRKISISEKNFEKKNFSKKERKKKENFLENKSIFSLSEFRHNLKIEILRSSREEVLIQICGIDFSLINSLRRILLGETASFSIHKVFFYENSSILNDEIIAHRLGLVPLLFPTGLVDFFLKIDSTDNQKFIFDLKVLNPQRFNTKVSVFSNSLLWKSYGLFYPFLKNSLIRPVFRDILILKLNPGQRVNCECHCMVGTGTAHSKFSPVGTAFYRIYPRIKIIDEILGKNVENFFNKCPVKVFDIEESQNMYVKKLIVSSPNFCTLCKECLSVKFRNTHPIRIGRIKNKVTFVIESTGVLSPEILFHRAVFLLVGKCNEALSSLYKNFSFEAPNL